MGETNKNDKGFFKRAADAVTGPTEELEQAFKKLTKPTVPLTVALGKLETVADKIGAIVHPFSEVHKAASELAKSVGLSSKSIMGIATRTIEQNRKMQLSMSYNVSTPEMIRMQQTMMSSIGRNVAIDQVGTIQKNANGEVINPNYDSTLENLIAATKAFGEGYVGNIVAGFDKVGLSMKAAAKATGKLYSEASEYGINLQAYAENFTSNLQMAQMYNFRNGVNGLKEMARKATEIRQDMKQVASFADKVGSVTGAVETAANLQVLGGSFASLANPLAMLNESLTDMNALQDRFTQMTAGAATYNSVTHQIEMDPVTRQIMKRAAESMGVDPANMIDQAYAQARRTEIDRQLKNNGIEGLRADVLKLLPNIGEFDSETGVAGATIGGKFKTLSEIAAMPELQDKLIEETRSESDDIKAIAKSVMSIDEVLSGRKEQLRNEAARNVIIPGSISGQTALDMVMDFVEKDFGPQVMNAAGRIDLVTESLEAFGTVLGEKFLVGRINTLDATMHASTPEEAKAVTENEFKKLFGEGPIANAISSAIGSLSAGISEWLSGVNEFTIQQANFNILPGKDNEAVIGVNGRPPITPEQTAAAAKPDALRDITTQAAAKLETGTNPTIEGSNPVRTLNASLTGISQEAAEKTINEFLSGALGIPYIPLKPTGNSNGVTISGNEQSIPGVQVIAPTQTTQTKNAEVSRQGVQSNDFNLNLSGTLKMDINGDKGKIGTADIMYLLQNNPSFQRELAKAIADSMAKLNTTGLNGNQ